MKVSVCIPYYNDERFLRQSVESVLAQSLADFELVLVNHASTDTSRQIARSFADARIVHVDMPVNNGAGGGLVLAEFIRVARGEYVKFFCADDVMRPDCLKTLVGFLDARPDLGMAFGNTRYVDVQGRSLRADWFSQRQHFSADFDELGFLREYSVGHSTLPWIGSLVRRKLMNEVSLDATLVMMFDMSVWTQLLLKGVRMGLVCEIVADYRIHSGQVSSSEEGGRTLRMSIFEHQAFFRLFQACPDLSLLKRLYADDRFVAVATTPEDMRIAVALHYLRKRECAYWAYVQLHDLMERPESRRHLELTFGMTVAQFRLLLEGRPSRSARRSRWVRFRNWLLESCRLRRKKLSV